MTMSDFSLSTSSRESYVYSHRVFRYNEQYSEHYEAYLIGSIKEIVERQIKA